MKLIDSISHILFIHLFTYFRLIKNTILDKGDKLIYDHLPQISSNEMIYDLPLQQGLSQWQLAKIVFFGQLKYKTIYVLTLYIIESACRNITSVIMSILIGSIIQHSEDSYRYAIILIIVQALANLSRHHSITQSMEFSAKVRFTLLNLLYKKVLTLEGELDMGKIVSLATSDISMLEYYFMLIFQIFVVPISFIFGSIILCLRFNGAIGLAGIGIMTLVYPIQLLIQRKSINFTRAGKERQDQRMKQTNEFVEGIRIIKMQTWEDVFIKKITNERKEEQKNNMDNLKYQAIDRSFNFFAQIWGSCIFFMILYYNDFNLNVQDMISTIQLLQYFKSNGVQQVSYGIQSVLNINLTFSRLLNILNIKEKQSNQEFINPDFIIQFNKFSQYTIKNLNLTLQKGEFITITGSVGSGKSTILKAILSNNNNNCTQQPNLSKGYVEQEPFLFSDTIRNNIIFGRQFIEELYFEVIKATCLDEDINKMQLKDSTIIGDKGSTLSGGQKQRLSLARALYYMPDLYLLDDPFSAIDNNIANQIFQKALNNFLYFYQPTQTNKRPAVILVTHSMNIVKQCLNVFHLENGQLIKLSNLDDISKDNIFDSQNSYLGIEQKQENQKINQTPTLTSTQIQTQIQTQIKQIANQQNIEQNRYLRYFKFNNGRYLTIINVVLMNILSEVLYNLYYRLIAQFDEFNQNNRIDLLFLIICGLCVFVFFNNLAKYMLNSYGCLNANTQIHNQMLQSIAQGKIKYFDTNPPSQILTKFSMDLNIADTMINSTLCDLWELGSYFFTSLIALVILEPYFVFFMLITILLNYYVFDFFKNIILSTKELDLTIRSQIIDLFRKSVNGLEIIKVYEQEDWFKKQFVQLSNKCIMSNVTFYYSQRIFAFIIDLIGFVVQGIGIYVLISLDSPQSELFVQALLLLIIFNENQQWFLRQLLSFGSYMNSVSRMFELIDQERESNQNENPSFKSQGQLILKNIYLKYSEEYALSGFSLEVQKGEKIGIVGRTGAGKSSIIQVLFRMYEVESAEQIELDGFDIRQLSLKQLRESIGIIPQNPLIFEGNLKYNLDPYNQYKDEDLTITIKQVGLYQKFKLQDKLVNLSIGEKQLVFLARILMTGKRIIVLDEATASVDNQTDQVIQELIKSQFQDRTILTVAHKMDSLTGYDRIIQVEDGQVRYV